jgi:hypothetical protein
LPFFHLFLPLQDVCGLKRYWSIQSFRKPLTPLRSQSHPTFSAASAADG